MMYSITPDVPLPMIRAVPPAGLKPDVLSTLRLVSVEPTLAVIAVSYTHLTLPTNREV